MTATRRFILAAVLMSMVPLFFIGGPNDYSQRSFKAFWNLGHILFFAVLTVLLLHRRRSESGARFLIDCIVAVIVTTIFGVAVEWFQKSVHRSADIHDIIKNTIGVSVALFYFLPSRKSLKKGILLTFQTITLIVLGFQMSLVLFAWADEMIARRQFPVLSSFETPFERYRWEGKHLVIDDNIHISGKASLRIQFTEDSTEGVKLRYFPRNWSGYQRLQFSLFNPAEKPISLAFRMKDRKHSPSGSDVDDSFNRHYVLAHGWNTITINLNSMITAPKGRHLDVHRVYGIRFFKVDSIDPMTMYIDDVKLLK